MESKKLHIHDEKKRPLLIGYTSFCSIYDFSLREEDLIKARGELKEEEQRKTENLSKLKQKLSGDPQLIFRTDDEFLLRYLRYQKFDCDKAHRVICKFYSTRKNCPDYMALTPRLRSLLNTGFFTCLPYREEGKPLMFLMDFRKWNLEEMSFAEAMQLYTAVCDIVSMSPHTQINGVCGIWDFRGLRLRHVSQLLHPSTLLLVLSILQDCYPWRLKYILAIHCNKLTRTAFSSLRPFLKKKIKERVHLFGSDMSELHEFINPVLLPKEYGGTLEEIDCRITDIVLDNLPYLE